MLYFKLKNLLEKNNMVYIAGLAHYAIINRGSEKVNLQSLPSRFQSTLLESSSDHYGAWTVLAKEGECNSDETREVTILTAGAHLLKFSFTFHSKPGPLPAVKALETCPHF